MKEGFSVGEGVVDCTELDACLGHVRTPLPPLLRKFFKGCELRGDFVSAVAGRVAEGCEGWVLLEEDLSSRRSFCGVVSWGFIECGGFDEERRGGGCGEEEFDGIKEKHQIDWGRWRYGGEYEVEGS